MQKQIGVRYPWKDLDKLLEVGDEVVESWSGGGSIELGIITSINLKQNNFSVSNASTRTLLDMKYFFIEFTKLANPTNSTNSNPSFMSSVKEFFRNMTASPDEKLLKEFGIEDPIGSPTAQGLALSAEITYKANRAEIIKIAQQMKEEKDAEKE